MKITLNFQDPPYATDVEARMIDAALYCAAELPLAEFGTLKEAAQRIMKQLEARRKRIAQVLQLPLQEAEKCCGIRYKNCRMDAIEIGQSLGRMAPAATITFSDDDAE